MISDMYLVTGNWIHDFDRLQDYGSYATEYPSALIWLLWKLEKHDVSC